MTPKNRSFLRHGGGKKIVVLATLELPRPQPGRPTAPRSSSIKENEVLSLICKELELSCVQRFA